MSTIQTGLYKHYKGKLYHLIGISRHTETLEEYCVYQALYDDYALWIRPAQMFFETIEYNGQNVPRFSFVQPLFVNPPCVEQR